MGSSMDYPSGDRPAVPDELIEAVAQDDRPVVVMDGDEATLLIPMHNARRYLIGPGVLVLAALVAGVVIFVRWRRNRSMTEDLGETA